MTAARIAASCAANGSRVDNLVLIGTPIEPAFVAALRLNPMIGAVLVIDLAAEGDPIRAGMSIFDLFAALPRLIWQGVGMLRGKPGGHFCLLERGEPGRRARRAIAARLVAAGVR